MGVWFSLSYFHCARRIQSFYERLLWNKNLFMMRFYEIISEAVKLYGAAIVAKIRGTSANAIKSR